MGEKGSKIVGLVIFIILVSGIFYITFLNKKKASKGEIKMFEVTGNYLLEQAEYLKFAKLDNSTSIEELTLPVIKDRIKKHPYIQKVDVEYDGIGGVRIEVKEKQLKAVILNSVEPLFITEQFQLLPIFSNTKFSDLPLISNLSTSNELKPLTFFKNNEILESFMIIDAARLTNEGISKKLAEINLRKGGDIVLTFSGIKLPIIYGKTGAAKKMVYLDIMWDDMLAGKEIVENSDYIDLRFANEIYVGKSEKTGLN